MSILKCRVCGGNLILRPGSRIAQCEYCGTQQTVPLDAFDVPEAPAPAGLQLLPEYLDGVRLDRTLRVGGDDMRITLPLASGEILRYYFCLPPEDGTALLAVAASAELNSLLEQTEQTLALLSAEAQRFERDNAAHGGKPLSYDRLFPRLRSAEISAAQGSRRVHVLTLPEGATLPLAHIQANHDRVDLKTGAWIMGRMLKLLSFAHEIGLTVPVESAGILIDPDRHGLVFYDWSRAGRWPEGVPAQRRAAAISEAAALCLALTDEPDSCSPGERDYLALLHEMQRLQYDDALAAHRAFYDLIRQIWGIAFHPFTIHHKEA